MAVAVQDIRPYGINNPASLDATTPVGGAVKLTFSSPPLIDVSGAIQGVSSDAGDVGSFVLACLGYNLAGVAITDSVAPNGQTPTAFAQSFSQMHRGNINNTAALGDVAIEAVTPIRANTAQAGSAAAIILDAGASAVDRFYSAMIIRLTGGTGAGQIRQIISYSGSTKEAVVDRDWDTPPDNTTTFRLSGGFYFQRAPSQVVQPWRLFFEVSGPSIVDPSKTVYDKFFFVNDHPTDSITAPFISMVDSSGLLSFGLAAAINDSLTTADRLTAPAGITFGTAPVVVPGGTLGPGDRIGVWVAMTMPPGQPAVIDAASRFSIGWTP